MKEFEFRPAAENELAQVRELLKYAFAGESEEGEFSPGALRPEWSLCAFDGAQMAASSGAYPFEISMNGATMACAGVTAVATDPGYRRRGLVRELMVRTLARAREQGMPAAMLWATMGAIYQRFGYGLASHHVVYEFDPRFAGLRDTAGPAGDVRRVVRDAALPALRDLYGQYCAERNLLIHRSPVMWDAMLPTEGKTLPHIAICYDARERPVAYTIYRTKLTGTPGGTGPWQQLNIVDLVWLTIEGYRGIWEYLRRHDLVRNVMWIAVPEDDPAPQLLMEPRVLGRRSADGIWLRVIDAAAALAARGYQYTGEVSVRVASDALCPWNERLYEIASDGQSAEVRTRSSGDADLVLAPNALSSLLCGHTSASALARAGLAESANAKRLPLLDAFFATRFRPTCANDF